MKQHIKSLPHHPKRVIVISLFLAICIGAFGYFKINQKINSSFNDDTLNKLFGKKKRAKSEITFS